MAALQTPRPGPRKLSPLHWNRKNLAPFAVLLSLCSASYFLGVHNHTTTTNTTKTLSPCNHTAPQLPHFSNSLDFSTHHTADEFLPTTNSVPQFPPCDAKYFEYTPCEDRDRSLKHGRDRLVYRERHCPSSGEVLRCLIPAPWGYRNPFPWPASRDVAWFANVPHRELAVEKAVQNWVRVEGEMFRFPGGGTSFPNGAEAYIREIEGLIPLRDGSIRTALDTGCGVASFGGYLLSRNILTMSFAPRDSHKAQVQFALERGIPAMIGVLASIRLPYPSRAFDMAHCSRCLIPWHLYDGQYLMEVDRVLRPGGFWVLSGPPINWKRHSKGWERTQEDLSAEQSAIEAIADRLCWIKYQEKGDVAIWQKPLNHMNCNSNRKLIKSTPFCKAQNPDKAWYTKLDTCVTPLPDTANSKEVAGCELKRWPERLTAVPPRITSGTLSGITPEMFSQDVELWKKRVGYYKTVINQLGQKGRYRNLLDMNAKFGGFASALIDDPVWVMNMVPTTADVDTLGVIYERGLIGTYQDWCEAMSTYPRTYDFIHADSVFSLYKGRCEMEDILLEMDRILRPEGTVVFRDDVDTLVKIKSVIDGMRWDNQIVDHEDGPMEREKLLLVVKTYWTAPNEQNSEWSSIGA